ncbi:MAG TPA: HAD family hydrolase, partial [Rikenellaceae bacterium]|nr:HAD family hydrolase [Rikenellaceae bacterium]
DLCQSEGISTEEIAMVGNSFKSDIQPVIEIGGYGIHIPFHTMWQHEVTEEFDHPNITRLDSFDQLGKIFIDNE